MPRKLLNGNLVTLAFTRVTSNETEISHVGVRWQTLWTYFVMAPACSRMLWSWLYQLVRRIVWDSSLTFERGGEWTSVLMATFSAHTESPPPPRRTPAGSRASSR